MTRRVALELERARARATVADAKPKRGRKERDYLGDFNACFPDFVPAETFEQLFFRIAIVSGLLGSDAKAYADVAARHPTGKSASGAPILPNHLADARKNNLRAERAKLAAARAERWERIDADRHLVAGQDPAQGADVIFTNRADRARRRAAWLSMGT